MACLLSKEGKAGQPNYGRGIWGERPFQLMG